LDLVEFRLLGEEAEAMVRVGRLDDEARMALERLRRRAVGRVSQRAHMVLLSARGYSVTQIAEIFAVGEDVVRTWLHRFQQAGPAGLADRPRPGRPPKDRLARHIVDAQASNSPSCNGLVQSCWTVGLLAAFLATRFHLVFAPCSVRRYLKLMGWRWRRPRLAPATHAPGFQKKRDPAAPAKLAAIAAALATSATVLYLDECELHLLPIVRAMWMKGARLRIPTPGQNAKRVLFGALDARTGALVHLVRERKRALDFVAFLDRLAQCYPRGEVVLVLDNVITHDAKLVRAWLACPEHARFTVRWLPKYAAHEHNPIERVWGLVKDHVAANRLHGSIDLLVATAERYLVQTRFCAPHPTPDSGAVPTGYAA
jgi:transposase